MKIPADDAPWVDIETFALTFDGYEAFGNALVEISNRHMNAGTVPSTLEELRGCLFFEQRRWRHFGEAPDERALRHIRALLAEIRARSSGT